jgi:ribonuclease Z
LRLQKSADVIRIHGGRGTLVVVAAMLAGFWREGSAPIPLEFVPLTEGRRITAENSVKQLISPTFPALP